MVVAKTLCGTIKAMDDPTPVVVTAAVVAHQAHFGALNPKNGEDYINHPRRVAGYAAELARDAGLSLTETGWLVAAAWLHDVIEDTDVDADELAKIGLPGPVIEVVELLTRRPDVPAEAYYAAIAVHRLARLCKVADLYDNTDPGRMAVLDAFSQVRLATRYAKAFAALTWPVPEHVADLARLSGAYPDPSGHRTADLMPQRIQRERTKGWRMPPGAVYVGRPTRWGNPWRIVAVDDPRFAFGDAADVRHESQDRILGRFDRISRSPGTGAPYWAVRQYESEVTEDLAAAARTELAGRDLVCWCPLGQPCHADVLLKLANPDRIGPATA